MSEIAEETRISTRFLEAIEKEEFEALPGGIFNRGFIRTYAERVGLDPEEMLVEYERLIKSNELPLANIPDLPNPARPQRKLYPVAIGALALLIAGYYAVTRETRHAPENLPPVAAEEHSSPVLPNSIPAPASADLRQEPSSVAAAAEPQPASPKTALSVEMEVQETTWIKVEADGKDIVPGEILEPGMTRKFTAESSMTLTIGNAAGLSMKFNDRKVKPLGRSGQVRELVITPENFKDFTS